MFVPQCILSVDGWKLHNAKCSFCNAFQWKNTTDQTWGPIWLHGCSLQKFDSYVWFFFLISGIVTRLCWVYEGSAELRADLRNVSSFTVSCPTHPHGRSPKKLVQPITVSWPLYEHSSWMGRWITNNFIHSVRTTCSDQRFVSELKTHKLLSSGFCFFQ